MLEDDRRASHSDRLIIMGCLVFALCLGPLVECASAEESVRVIPKLGHRSYCLEGKFSSDGEIFATVGPDKIVVWRRADQSIVATFNAHAGDLAGISFVPGTEQLYSLGKDGTLVLQDARTGRLVKRIRCEPGISRGLQVSPRGKYVAAVSKKAASVVHLETGETVFKVPSEGDVCELRWQADEKAFWLCTTTILLSRVDVPKQSIEVLLEEGGSKDACVLADGQLVARTKNKKMVEVWDVGTRKMLWQKETPPSSTRGGEYVQGIVPVKDGSSFLLSSGGDILQSDPKSGSFTKMVTVGRWQPDLALDNSGEFLVCSGWRKPVLVELGTKSVLEVGPSPLKVGGGLRTSLAAVRCEDSLSLFLFGTQRGLRWDLSTLQATAIQKRDVRSRRFLVNGELYETVPQSADAAGGPPKDLDQVARRMRSMKNLIQVTRRMRDKKEICRLSIASLSMRTILSPQMLSDDLSNIYLVGMKRATILNVASQKQVELEVSSPISRVAFSADGRALYRADIRMVPKDKRGIAVFDVATGLKSKQIAVDAALGRDITTSLVNGADLYAIASKVLIQVRDLPSNELKSEIQCMSPYEFYGARRVVLHDDGRRVMFTERKKGRKEKDYRVGVASIGSGERLWVTGTGTQYPGEIAFSPAGTAAFVAFDTGEIHVFDMQTGKRTAILLSFDDSHHLARTPDGYYKATGNASTLIQLQTSASAGTVPVEAHPELNNTGIVVKAVSWIK